MNEPFLKYAIKWPAGTQPIAIEMWMIQKGGRWVSEKSGKTYGEGLFYHYKELQKIIWPQLDHHRWSDLVLKTICENSITAILGPKSSGKTHDGAKFALTDYYCFPNETGILVSSTTLDALDRRIWGEIIHLHKLAKERFDWLPGNLVNFKRIIVTDDIEEEGQRDVRNGIIAVACKIANTYVGLGNYVGFKNKRVRLFADEGQFMGDGFLNAISNLDGNPDFKAVIMGNPIDPTDQLGRAAEPEVGWSSLPEPQKTEGWKTRFMNGVAINLVGTDSPNFDFDKSLPTRYKYLIDQRRIDNVAKFWGRDSHQYYSQCVGVMKQGLTARRVITRQICLQGSAFEETVWGPGKHSKIYGIDAACSGTEGDRCVGGWIETGFNLAGLPIIKIHPPKIIPVSLSESSSPEDQIAQYVQQDVAEQGISADSVFYDATGRGSLGAAFARTFGATVPVPVEFGGRPSQRPVRHDLFIMDEKTGRKRLQTCWEHYSKFVSELWFSVRYAIEAGQIRELPDDVAFEGYQREWMMVAGNKVEVETKANMKERTGRSPDLFDWLATCVEGARQKGFKIQRLGVEMVETGDINWVEELSRKHNALWKSKQLTFK